MKLHNIDPYQQSTAQDQIIHTFTCFFSIHVAYVTISVNTLWQPKTAMFWHQWLKPVAIWQRF